MAVALGLTAAGATAVGLAGPRPTDTLSGLPVHEPLTTPAAASGPRGQLPDAGPPGLGRGTGGVNEALAAAPVEPKQRGVALGMFAEDVSFSYVPLLKEIAALGATHVALIVPLYQTNGRATDLALHTRFSPTLELIADTVRAARREHLEVTLFPIIRLTHPAPGEWRGTLAPSHPDLWFRAYRDLLGDLAAVAAQTGATRLVVGSELSSLDGELDRWRPLLERIRGIFPGHLIYSANWDHYRQAALFELVDEEGVVAYFNLRDDARAPSTEAALQNAWRRHQDELLRWHAGHRRPLLFTEVGYRSRAGSTAAPWDEGPGGTPDLDEQRRGFAAFRQVWAKNPALDGAYVWNWYGFGGPSSVGYTPRGKPAAQEVRRLLQEL
ncbi:MAG: hypothetical protein ABI560_04375 [Myxococcales bacterium]